THTYLFLCPVTIGSDRKLTADATCVEVDATNNPQPGSLSVQKAFVVGSDCSVSNAGAVHLLYNGGVISFDPNMFAGWMSADKNTIIGWFSFNGYNVVKATAHRR